jgi:hypothetical protein
MHLAVFVFPSKSGIAVVVERVSQFKRSQTFRQSPTE